MSKDSQYVIATIKPWNVVNFEKYFGRQKNFHLITKKSDLTLSKLQKINPRYIFFPHWSWIIPEEIWIEFECVTIHETDLPYGRGGSPIQNLITQGHTKTKITAIRIDAGIDTGEVYLKRSVSLHGSAQQIFERISERIFSEIIPTIITKEPVPKKQIGHVTIFKRRTSEQSRITGKENIHELFDLIRMLDAESYPHAFTDIGKYRIEFKNAKLHKHGIDATVRIYERE